MKWSRCANSILPLSMVILLIAGFCRGLAGNTPTSAPFTGNHISRTVDIGAKGSIVTESARASFHAGLPHEEPAEVDRLQLLFEDFEGAWGPYGDIPPAGWTILDFGDEAVPTWNTNDWYNYYWDAIHMQVARVYYSPIENQDEWLISPVINVPAENCSLKFWHYYSDWDAIDFGYVLGSIDGGVTWPETIAIYSVDILGANEAYYITPWAGGEANVRIAFQYVGYYGWYWMIDSVDVSTYFTPTFDAEVLSIDNPNIDCFVMTPAVPLTVRATVRNNGLNSETFNVLCSIDSAGTIVYTDLESVTLNPGMSTQVNFSPQWNAPQEDVNYFVTVATLLGGDEIPSNDSLASRAKAVTWTNEILYDDGIMSNAWRWLEPYSYDSIIAKKFEPPYYPCRLKYAAVYLLSETDPFWPWPDATHDPVELTVWLDTDGDDVPDNLTFRDTVTGDAVAPSWVYVVPFDTVEIWSYNFWIGLNNLPGGGEEGIGLDATTNFLANKYIGSYGGVWHTQDMYAGDEMIRAYVSMGDLEHDVGLISIDAPAGNVVAPGVALDPGVTVHNFGSNIESFLITCYIDSCGANEYMQTQIVNNLGAGNSTSLTFPSWTPTTNNGQPYRVWFVADLVGDQIPQNDTLLKWVVTGQVPPRNYLLIQNYWSWFPITGWASIDSVCQDNGIPLTIYPDDSIGRCDLSPFTKVILPSDQDQAFYDSVQNHIDWFKTYVQNGGILQVDCADHGSGYMGQWDTLRLLPCDYEYRFATNDEARRNVNCHEILLIPNEIGDAELGVWNYVTHGYLKTVWPPDVDTIIRNMESPVNSPCLTVDDYFDAKDDRAGGVVIYTTMTVEWAWAYGYSNLLENLVLYPNWIPINVSIELTGFFAVLGNEGIILKWQTGSEIDNAAWQIARKSAGETWEVIARLPSAGNSPSGNSYAHTDKDVDLSEVHQYRLGSVDLNGNVTWHSTIVVDPNSLGVPKTFGLMQNYPNPFSNRTAIRYQVARKANVRIMVYDVSGRRVAILINNMHDPGFYKIHWNGLDERGKDVGQGVYFYRMEAEGFYKTRRLIRL